MSAAWPVRSRVVALGLLAVLVLFAGGTMGGADERQVVSDLAMPPLVLAAGAACAYAATRQPGRRHRRAWLLIGASLMSWGLGTAVWSFYELVLHHDVPFPSWADAGYLGLIPLAVAGVTLLPTSPQEWRGRLRTLLDGAIVGGALLFIAWPYVLGPIYLRAGSVLEATLALAYPLGDVLIVTALVVAFARAEPEGRLPFLWVVGGFLLVAFADGAFAYLSALEMYTAGNVVDSVWLAGFFLVALGAVRSLDYPASVARPERPRPTWVGIVPIVPVAASAVVAVERELRMGSLEPVLFWDALAVVVLLLVSAFALVSENAILARRTQQAYEGLKASETRRSQIVNMVAHDIATPLTPLKVQTFLLKGASGADAEARAASLEIMARNVRTLELLVTDFLDVARLDSGRLKLSMAPIDLGEVVREAAASLEDVARQRGLTLVVEAPRPLRTVADPGRINQVLFNLLTNAFKFTPRGGRVEVRATPQGHRLLVAVRDTGRGIDRADIPRLFQPFSQVHPRDAVPERGTGLGLYICRSIVEAQGGRIWCESPGLGHGATFFFDLPGDEPVPAWVAPASTAVPAPRTRPSWRPMPKPIRRHRTSAATDGTQDLFRLRRSGP